MKDTFEVIDDDNSDTASDAPARVSGAEAAQRPVDEVRDTLNDAEILGPEPEGFAEFLAKPATFLQGELWGPKDRRNTQDGKWQPVTAAWGAWLMGAPASKGRKASGLSRHPVGKYKEGHSIVLGTSIGGTRKAKAMDEMHALGLDIDSGAKLDDVVRKIREENLLAIVYTSYNHGKSGLEIDRDDVMRNLKIDTDPDLNQVKEYLRTHSKSRYEDDFVAAVNIEDGKRQTKEGVKIALSTPPLEKFRIIFPLAEPVKLIELASTQQAALDVWEDKITGMAWEKLGVHFDTSCTDPSRLFFTARHPEGSGNWRCLILRGYPLKFEDVPTYKKQRYAKQRAPQNAFEIAGGEEGYEKIPEAQTPSGRRLNDWHRVAKDRFMLATLLEDTVPEKIRHAGGEAQGHVHVECPFEHEHSKEGGTACMAVDAIESESEYWAWFCHHDSCQGRHKLQFLEEALAQGWFDEDVLFDEDGVYLLEPGEEEPEREQSYVSNEDLEARASAFSNQSKAAEIEKFLLVLSKEGVDVTDRARVNEALAANTVLGKRDLNKMWQKLDRVQRKIEADRARLAGMSGEGPPVMFVDSDVDKQWEYGQAKLDEANAANPFLFEYMGQLSRVHRIKGKLRTQALDAGHFRHQLNTHAPYYKRQGEGGKVRVMAPKDVAEHLFTRDHDHYPPLSRVTSLPFFTAEGELVSEDGYHRESEVYLDVDGLELPPVPYEPTEGQVYDAKKLLITEFADFPLGGNPRTEILKSIDGAEIPAVANLLALIIQPFVREMYDKTPAAVVNKPQPGTGAGLITDCIHLIVDGAKATATPMPTNREEMPKTLLSVLRSSGTYIFWDNINHEMDSAELAAAITGNPYNARVLGISETLDIYVRAGMIFAANTLRMSDELRRRCFLIDLDAKCERPEDRGGWYRDDIEQWITDHRAEYVHAVLVLVNNWLAKGGADYTETKIASFEGWSKVLGGILQAAGITGFLGNRDQLYEEVSDEKTGEIYRLVAMMVAQTRKDKNSDFRVGKQKKGSQFIGILDLLNSRVDDEITLDDWNPKRSFTGDLEYNDAGTAGKRFKDAARNPYTVTFAEFDDRGREFEVSGTTTFEVKKHRGDLYYELHFEEKTRVPVPKDNEHGRKTR